jgi:lysine N6-hydroxylase
MTDWNAERCFPGSGRFRGLALETRAGTVGRAEAVQNRLHYKCVGIGAGPSNLSLASLIYSHPEVTNLFLEKKESFGWHDGQQIPGSNLQVSMLKDLVSLADPTNPFSFLAYLHAKGRLYHFINAQFDAVPREEFRNYMEWAACNNGNVVLGQEVLTVGFDGVFVIETTTQTVTADNIVIGIGQQPWAPPQAQLCDTQFHVSEFLPRAAALGGRRVVVIGGGQSGAEAFLDLISRPGSQRPRRVSWISRRANYFPLDDSPFTNDYFMPCHSDHFFSLDRGVREAFNADRVLISDGISESTLREIYQKIYVLRFINGAEDLVELYPNRTVTGVAGCYASGWDVIVANNDQTGVSEHVEGDVIIWATGFQPARMDFLAPIASRLERDDCEYKIDSCFAVSWDGPADRGIFLQNAARQQRGLADPNLSLIAWRSQRILDRLLGVRTEHQDPSFIGWSGKSSPGKAGGA